MTQHIDIAVINEVLNRSKSDIDVMDVLSEGADEELADLVDEYYEAFSAFLGLALNHSMDRVKLRLALASKPTEQEK